jgi:hypothetical protein
MGAQLKEQAYNAGDRSIPRTKSSPRPPRMTRSRSRSSVLQGTILLPSSSPILLVRPPPRAATAKTPSEILLQIAEFALMALKEIIYFPYPGNLMNSPTTDFEMAETASLGVLLSNFLLVCRDFMAVGYNIFL